MPERVLENRYAGRTDSLRSRLLEQGLSAFLITMDDFHGSEYTKDHFHTLAYYSGFTGSAGTLLVTAPSVKMTGYADAQAFLWTDGRYFLQAEKELKGSGICLMRDGLAGVPSAVDFIVDLAVAVTGSGGRFVLGFDGRCVRASFTKRLREAFAKRSESPEESEKPEVCKKPEANINPEESSAAKLVFRTEEDLAGKLWEADRENPRPALVCESIWALSEDYAGKGRGEKLSDLLLQLNEKNADALVLTALDQIAWLLNLRGSDIAYNPVFFAFCIVSRKEAVLYLKTDDYPKELTDEPLPAVLRIRPYEAFWKDLAELEKGGRIWLDPAGVSEAVMETISRDRTKEQLLTEPSPVILQKAVKNETEIRNMKQAHIKDGVAVTKWICAVKQKPPLTELAAASLLETFRKEQSSYLGPSFAPILAFREHGAIVHYEPTPETDLAIEGGKGDFLLADTGGHYLQGTTDCTRTLALGEPDLRQKQHYTAVLAGHLALLDAVFLEGAAGSSLDQLAREPLYRLGLDYRHGTGHGVGYLLCVHEGPNAFRMKYTKENVILPGMITSDEPGVYLAEEYGIRLESLLLAEPFRKTEYGSFLHFVPLTMIPFDRCSILPEELSDRALTVLNTYHQTVFETLSPFLTKQEREWLCRECAPFDRS